jgi:phytol kinase
VSDILSFVGVLAGFAALFGLAEWLRAKGRSVELTRKLIHVGSGTITLTFPWLFSSHVPVLIMTVLCCVALMVVRYRRPLVSLHGVDRHSFGEIFFPVGIYLAFYFAEKHSILPLYPYAVAFLIFADSAAAIVGKRYGSLKYSIGDEQKSVAGSAVFLLVAIIIGYAATGSIASALLTASLLTLLESTATKGVDNFILPLAALVFLHEGAAISPITSGAIAFASLLLLVVVSAKRLDARAPVSAALLASTLLFEPVAIPVLVFLIVVGALSSVNLAILSRLRVKSSER